MRFRIIAANWIWIRAIVKVSYDASGVNFTREVFSSPIDQVIVWRVAADRRHQINFTASFTTPQQATVATEANDTLVLRGVNGEAFGIKGALKFQAQARVIAGGGQSSC